MSKLEELINVLCPGGVEYIRLGNMTKILRGKRLIKSQLSNNEKYPVFHGGLEPLGYYGESNRKANTVMVINVGASAGTVGYSNIEFWSSDGCFCLEHSTSIINRYAYYALLCCERLLRSKVRFAGIPTLDNKVVEDIKFPLPPLPVQREIVRILDNFTELTAELTTELTTELTARKKQYEYYRDLLLNYDDPRDISGHWMNLGEACLMRAGKTISSNSIVDIKNVDFSYPCYGGNGLRGYVKTYNQVSEAPLIGRQGALCGNVCFAEGKYYATEHAVVVAHGENFNARFLYYLLTAMNLNQYKTAGAQPGLSIAKLAKLMVPVPLLEEQERIVTILDRFDTLCNDLTSGLPAEIEARRKQYEYYRDKLLTFKEKVK